MSIVLVVEDDAHIRQVLRTLLQHEGFDVCEACDGLDGLDSILKNKPDCVVTDTMMPKMDGLKMLECVTAKGLKVPAIVVSAAIGLPDLGELEKIGVVAVFGKPFSFDRLIERVRKVVVGA